MTVFRLLMWPSNAAADLLGLVDEHERGMVRMLVNSLIWMTIAVVALCVAWAAIR
jgi:hypothetical protein